MSILAAKKALNQNNGTSLHRETIWFWRLNLKTGKLSWNLQFWEQLPLQIVRSRTTPGMLSSIHHRIHIVVQTSSTQDRYRECEVPHPDQFQRMCSHTRSSSRGCSFQGTAVIHIWFGPSHHPIPENAVPGSPDFATAVLDLWGDPIREDAVSTPVQISERSPTTQGPSPSVALSWTVSWRVMLLRGIEQN